MPDEPFNPRQAALNHAGLAEKAMDVAWRAAVVDDENTVHGRRAQAYADGIHALVSGLVYIGDQVSSRDGQSGGGLPTASKSVKVVATTPRTVLLEVDGKQHQFFAGDTLTVEGLTVTPYEPEAIRYEAALRRIAEHEEMILGGPPDDEMRQIAINALRGPV